MYKQLRLRLTLWYVFLSVFTFLALALVGTGICYDSITLTLNQSIESMLADAVAGVDYSQNGLIKFKLPDDKSLRTQWSQGRATVQLFDVHKNLVAEYGQTPGYPYLCSTDGYAEADINGRHIRMGSDPVIRKEAVVGYLQVQTPTDARAQAVMHFAITLAWVAPLLILSLGFSGYFFSGKASKPVEQAFAALRQFLNDAGHEFRTPIHLIQLTAENAMIGHEEDSELQQDLHTIVRTTDRMGRLVEDMMLLAKMEVKQISVHPRRIELDQLLADAVSEYALRAKEKSISLQSEPFPSCSAYADPDQLYRVIGNLIENAIRYTDPGGVVTVRLKTNAGAGQVKFSVQDTGIGIPAESVPKVFNRFYRVDKSRSRAAGGSGLGLSIVKAIVQMHKGRIELESQEGVGSTFHVWLPASASEFGINTGGHAIEKSRGRG